jgi:hypothetical protein
MLIPILVAKIDKSMFLFELPEPISSTCCFSNASIFFLLIDFMNFFFRYISKKMLVLFEEAIDEETEETLLIEALSSLRLGVRGLGETTNDFSLELIEGVSGRLGSNDLLLDGTGL